MPASARVWFTRVVCVVLVVLSTLFDTRGIAANPPLSVDLSTYARIGRFDLPTSPAPPNSQLAQEASAVTFNSLTQTLFIVGDEGTSVVQVSKTGELIDSMTLAPGEFLDTEGITYVGGGNQFVLVEERERRINLFTYIPNGTLHRSDVQSVKLGTTIGNIGLEGVSYDPFTSGFVLVKEKDPQSIFQTNVDWAAGTATNGSPNGQGSTNLFSPALANIEDFSDVFALSNLTSLNGQPDFSHLLVISQESGQIINVDRSGNVTSKLTIVADPGSPLSVTDMTMEGVTMDDDGNLYVVNENGGGDANHPQLWVYAPSSAANQPPTAVTLTAAVQSIPDDTSTASPVKLATIVVTDDGLGTNNLSVSGADAGSFQIIGTGLFLKAGTQLNAATKSSYAVIVDVDDPTSGPNPDASAQQYTLTITAGANLSSTLIISEVAPWSSGNSKLGADWFEVTNVGTVTQNVAGWKMDDNSHTFASAVSMSGITSIAPGDSVIFIERGDLLPATLAAARTAFLNLWFTNPPSLQIGIYNGSAGAVGLSTGGDEVNLYDTTGAKRASVIFGNNPNPPPPPAPTVFQTFDNTAGLNNTTIAVTSQVGVNGAFSIPDLNGSTPVTAIGSPGTLGAATTPVVTIEATDANAAEAGSDPGTFRLTRTGSTTGALTANYTIASGAGQANSSDYTPSLPGSATFASGQSFVDVTITPVNDTSFEGSETVSLTLFDAGNYDVGTPSTATVTIADDDPPDTTIDSSPVDPTNSTSASFTFSGSSPASAIARFECALDTPSFTTCVTPVTYTGLTEGVHHFAVRAVGITGGPDLTPATFAWTVDTTPPTITVGASVSVLWPANGKLVPDTISGTVADALSGVDPASVSFRVIDEYGQIHPTGALLLGSGGQFAVTLQLEASRLGADDDGRRYQIIVTATDRAGNQSSASAVVIVPHDRGR